MCSWTLPVTRLTIVLMFVSTTYSQLKPGDIMNRARRQFGGDPCAIYKITCATDRSPCENGGTCQLAVLPQSCHISCQCSQGFTGENCELEMSSRSSSSTSPPSETTPPLVDGRTITPEPNTSTNAAVITSETIPSSSQETEIRGNCSNNEACKNGVCYDYGLSYQCICDDDYVGFACETYCELDCQHDGTCVVVKDTMYCTCPYNYIGDTCQDVRTTLSPLEGIGGSGSDYWYPLGFSLGVLVLLVVLAIIVPYVLWKRRVILMMKLWYRFQSFEDDDSLLFDAFISFKSSTEDYSSTPEEIFVLQTLMPKLEQEMGFKICVHFRDFIPGETITNNVLWAIQNSRRTLMLVSNRYIKESVWCRLEYELAQQAVLERKQRIIPVIFENIDITIDDPTLKHILNSTTYLEWPGESDYKEVDKFWTRLNLSMPKLHSRTLPEPVNYVSQSSQDSTATDITTISAVSPTRKTHNGVLPSIGEFVTVDLTEGDNSKHKISTKNMLQDTDKQQEQEQTLAKKAENYLELLECTKL